MKRKKRVRRREKIAILRASGRGERKRSTGGEEAWLRAWRERRAELKRWREIPKKRVTVNLDADVLAWFRELGRGYQWEINRALRRVMEGEPGASNREL